jgi:hypothetical protein
MGRLLDALRAETDAHALLAERRLGVLRAESGSCPAATLATLRHSAPSVAEVAESQRSPMRGNGKESQESQSRSAPIVETERLLAALRAQGLPDEWLGLDHGDASQLAALSDNQLSTYVAMLVDTNLREHGKRPADETAAALCRSCGLIWVHPAVAAVAPMLDGWPRVLGCPWCHTRNRQAIPRPMVTCGDCRHFTRDHVNPAGGMGRCTASRKPLTNEPLPYPNVQRSCAEWRPGKPSTEPLPF